MMPMYMDSSQPRQIRPQGHFHQGFGSNHHHMPMDAPTPTSCECWPTPPPYYGSCVHGNFPAYNAYWPPCYPPQVQYHPYCVNHSGFHPHAPPYYGYQPFPVGYQPWCDSERKPGCGTCSPQRLYPKNDGGVVIEEHEPEIKKGDQGEAADPVRSADFPYPVIWIPNENAMNHVQRPAEVKAPENMKIQKSDPRVRNGYFPFDESTLKSLIQNQDMNKMQNERTMELPFDISKLKSLLQGQDGKEVQIQKNKEEQNQDRQKMQNGRTVELPFDISKLKSLLQGQDGTEVQIPKNKEDLGQYQFPIFLMPSHGKREDVEASEGKECSDKDPNSKSTPSGQYNEGQIAQYRGKEANAEEKRSMRTIPVENRLPIPRNIPVKLLENHLSKPKEPIGRIAKTKPAENTIESSKKEKPSSPPKASRLPPVCLRVDPLPKRKSGGSKSLSPPRRKEQPLRAEETKVASPLSSKKAETITVPEDCNVKCEAAKKEKNISEECLNATGTEKEAVESNSNQQEGANCEIVKPCETKENREKPAKKSFTEEEAARIIQSRFRGYDVRRGEPIKKLKEIATVREQMGNVKRRIKELEVSTDHQIQEKEIVILGEMVMSLLLKLDSVQGLHPSFRGHRKSLARELSDIQDKVDSLKKTYLEKEPVEEQVKITSQASDCPANMEHSRLPEENKTVSDSNTDKVLLLSPEDHPTNVAEEGSGLSEILLKDLEPATKTSPSEVIATSTTAPEKMEEVETVLSVNPSSVDGNSMTVMKPEEEEVMEESLEDNSKLAEESNLVSNSKNPEEASLPSTEEHPIAGGSEEESGLFTTAVPEKIGNVETVLPTNRLETDGSGMTVTKSEEDRVVAEGLKESPQEISQELETTHGVTSTPTCVPEIATEVSEETETKASEDGDEKGEYNGTILPSDDIEVSELLPIGVIDDETQLVSQDSETASQEETNIDQVTSEPQEEKEQIQEKEVITKERSQEKEVSAEERSQEKEVSAEEQSQEQVITLKEQPPRETELTEHETPEEIKKLTEENQQFKETMESLVKAGREQLEIISKLTGRVKSLEKKLSQKKKRAQIGHRKPCRGKHATKPMSPRPPETVL